ncbi:MAG: hypothetical protein QMD46_09550 [Methanomicrobiales archaeon]|nr:hypothetical protein [Methanomicrobiales archaeon]
MPESLEGATTNKTGSRHCWAEMISREAQPKTQEPKAEILLEEEQQLVAGVFASKEAAEAAIQKIEGFGPLLQNLGPALPALR